MAANKLLEELADIEHKQWWHWSNAALANLKTMDSDEPDAYSNACFWFEEKWSKNWKPYAELSEEVKEHDRKWAKIVLAIVEREMDKARQDEREKKLIESPEFGLLSEIVFKERERIAELKGFEKGKQAGREEITGLDNDLIRTHESVIFAQKQEIAALEAKIKELESKSIDCWRTDREELLKECASLEAKIKELEAKCKGVK